MGYRLLTEVSFVGECQSSIPFLNRARSLSQNPYVFTIYVHHPFIFNAVEHV
jgi:hypothetical protein